MKSKTAPMKAPGAPKVSTPSQGQGGGKPHIRMRHLKPGGGASAFPTAPVAFPQSPGAMGGAPDMGAGGGAAPPIAGAAGPGAAGGDLGQ